MFQQIGEFYWHHREHPEILSQLGYRLKRAEIVRDWKYREIRYIQRELIWADFESVNIGATQLIVYPESG